MGRSAKSRKKFFEHAPKYQREYVPHTPSKVRPPSERTPEKIGNSYWLKRFHITEHAINRYIERVIKSDKKISELSHKEKVAVHQQLVSEIPSSYKNTTTHTRYKLKDSFQVIVKSGVVVTII